MGIQRTGLVVAVLASSIIIIGLYFSIKESNMFEDDTRVMQIVFRLDKDSIHTFEDINNAYHLVTETIEKDVKRKVFLSYLDNLKYEYEYGTLVYDKNGSLIENKGIKKVILTYKDRGLRTTKYKNAIFYR